MDRKKVQRAVFAARGKAVFVSACCALALGIAVAASARLLNEQFRAALFISLFGLTAIDYVLTVRKILKEPEMTEARDIFRDVNELHRRYDRLDDEEISRKPPLRLLEGQYAFHSPFRNYIGLDVKFLSSYRATMDEAEGVMAHELAHANDALLRAWYVLRAMFPVVCAILGLMLAALWRVRPRPVEIKLEAVIVFTLIVLTGVITLLQEKYFARQCEHVADARAALYVRDVAPLLRMVEKLNGSGYVAPFVDRIWKSHPEPEARLSFLRSLR